MVQAQRAMILGRLIRTCANRNVFMVEVFQSIESVTWAFGDKMMSGTVGETGKMA